MVISRRVGIAAEIFPELLLIDDFEIAKKIHEVNDDYKKHSDCFLDMKNRHYSRLLLENLVKDHVDYYREAYENT